MSSRVFVRGAGTVCLITAALGFGLATEKGDHKSKAPPGPEDGEQKPDGRLLRAPMPTPGFGMTTPAGQPILDSSFAVRTRKSDLLGSASKAWVGSVPSAKRPDLPMVEVPAASAALTGAEPSEIAAAPAPVTMPAASRADPVPTPVETPQVPAPTAPPKIAVAPAPEVPASTPAVIDVAPTPAPAAGPAPAVVVARLPSNSRSSVTETNPAPPPETSPIRSTRESFAQAFAAPTAPPAPPAPQQVVVASEPVAAPQADTVAPFAADLPAVAQAVETPAAEPRAAPASDEGRRAVAPSTTVLPQAPAEASPTAAPVTVAPEPAPPASNEKPVPASAKPSERQAAVPATAPTGPVVESFRPSPRPAPRQPVVETPAVESAAEPALPAASPAPPPPPPSPPPSGVPVEPVPKPEVRGVHQPAIPIPVPEAAPVSSRQAALQPAPLPSAAPKAAPARPPLAPVARNAAGSDIPESFINKGFRPPNRPQPTSALVPQVREASTLGLSGNGQVALKDPAALNPTGALGAPGLPYTPVAGQPLITDQDELILEVKVDGFSETDTIIAYGTRAGLYLPLGTMARILDLAIAVGKDGHHAEGWILSQERTLVIDTDQGTIVAGKKTIPIDHVLATAYNGELYLRLDQFNALFPLKAEASLRSQSIQITTLEPFPFEERRAREQRREKLTNRLGQRVEDVFDRVDLPYEAFTVPTADIALRAVADNRAGPRVEGEMLLTGDIGYLSGEAYLNADTIYGLTAARVQVGRVDPDAKLLGPLKATEFEIGDVSSTPMQLGLRGVSGRGFTLTNAPVQETSVFDKVDLRGILPDGYEVELYRNDILVGSTRDAVNGQYQFLQVPVDFGLNVFRLVFYGPQGQRSEVVQRMSVGDGRLRKGQFVYSVDAVQQAVNVLGVHAQNWREPDQYGDLRFSGQVAYGLTTGLTATLGGSWFQRFGVDHWLGTAGIRTSVSGIALKADVGAADTGGKAFGAGMATRIGRSALTLSHTEYTGLFQDETKAAGGGYLRRATELDFNTSFTVGNSITGLVVPLNLRLRNYVDVDGRDTLVAGLRASTRLRGLMVSNTLDYSRTSGRDIETNAQLFGNFDLATVARSKLNARVSLGYELTPAARIVNTTGEVSYALDDRTAVRASAAYLFDSKKPILSLSGARDFDRFTLALDGNYNFVDDSYMVGLRIAFGLGRDPSRGSLFMARSGLASSGGATVRAFRDMDGDGIYGPKDELLEGVTFASSSATAETGADGIARVTGLGANRRVNLQLDPSTLPDIDLAPVKPGVELVPRPGRMQALDFPVIALSEVEGMARFEDASSGRGVSGVRLNLVDDKGKVVAYAKTEVDGYFFFERVPPGQYRLQIDPDQVERLQLCPLNQQAVAIGYDSSVVKRDLAINTCDAATLASK